jgi:hypothetical protein
VALAGTEPTAVGVVADALADALGDDNRAAGVRTDAAAALAAVADDDPAAVTGHAPVVVDALEDDAAAVRGHATHALAAVAEDDPTAAAPGTGALADRLSASDAAVRAAAANALTTVADADPNAVATVATTAAGHLADRQPAVRRGVAQALASVAETDPEAVVPVVAECADALGDADEAVRVGVADAIAAVADAAPHSVASAVDAAVDDLDDVDAVRQPLAAAVAAVAVADPDAVAPHVDEVATHLTDDADAVREPLADAVAAVARDGAEDGDVDALTDSLEGEDAWVRGYAARALVKAADDATTDSLPPALGQLVDRLDDDADAARCAAAMDVANVANEDPKGVVPAVDAVVAALDDTEVGVRAGAARALAAVAGADARAVTDANAVPRLVDRLNDDDAVRDPVLDALSTVAPDPDADVRPVVGLLLARLGHDAPEERRRAARALTRVEFAPEGDASVADALLDAVADDATRVTATRTLATLATADDAAASLVVDRVTDADPVAAVALAGIAAFDPLAANAPALTDAAVDTDPVVRRGATRALAAIASAREDVTPATGVLVDYADAADAADADVRARAAHELGRHALARPDDARPVVGDVTALFDADDELVRGHAAVAAVSVAVDDPRAVAASDPALSRDAADDLEWLADAVAFLRGIAGGDVDPTGPAKALAGRLDDDREFVRAVGALAAGTLEGTRPTRLADALADDALVVRAAVARALAAVAARDPASVEPVVDRLAGVLSDDPAVAAPAARALAAVARSDPNAADTAGAIGDALVDPDPRVQAAAARALGHAAPNAHTTRLRVCRVDGTDRVRQAAVDALEGLADDSPDHDADGDSWLARLSPKRVFGGTQ